MRLHKYRNKSVVISILLMMVCVQSFSMHFHFADGDDEYQPHAHAHTLGSTQADHVTTEHHDEVSTDILETLAKQSLSLDLLVPVLIALVFVSRSKSHHRPSFSEIRPRHHLLFFRPPLRAPPL